MLHETCQRMKSQYFEFVRVILWYGASTSNVDILKEQNNDNVDIGTEKKR